MVARYRQRLVINLQRILLLSQVRVCPAHAVQGHRLAALLSHFPPDGERLVEILECLRPLAHGGVGLSQIVQRVRLAGAAARLLQVRRQRIVQLLQIL